MDQIFPLNNRSNRVARRETKSPKSHPDMTESHLRKRMTFFHIKRTICFISLDIITYHDDPLTVRHLRELKDAEQVYLRVFSRARDFPKTSCPFKTFESLTVPRLGEVMRR